MFLGIIIAIVLIWFSAMTLYFYHKLVKTTERILKHLETKGKTIEEVLFEEIEKNEN